MSAFVLCTIGNVQTNSIKRKKNNPVSLVKKKQIQIHLVPFHDKSDRKKQGLINHPFDQPISSLLRASTIFGPLGISGQLARVRSLRLHDNRW
jgi:hypothetical protein